MTIDKKDAINLLEEIALLLKLKGENPFKIRAYENGARILSTMDVEFSKFVLSGEITKTKGFGKALVEKLAEFVNTGTLQYLENLQAEFPESLFEMMKLRGVGPKKIKIFYDDLKIATIDELEKACRDGRVANLPGMGQKTAETILDSIKKSQQYESFFLYATIRKTSDEIVEYLSAVPCIQEIEIAGSLRRFKEVTKDIDIIIASDKPNDVMDHFIEFEHIDAVVAKGTTKSSIILNNGMQVDLRVVGRDIFPFALHHFTGSKDHNVAMRSRAISMGYKISEWGLFKVEDGKEDQLISCESETEFFKHLGLNYIPPELRENMGEIEYAGQNNFVDLVVPSDYKGVLHCHSHASDGRNSLDELIDHAVALGHRYLGVTDHSKSSFQANGLSVDRLLDQIDLVNEKKTKYANAFTLYSGIECDILKDGSLDYEDQILEKLDFVIVSVHSSFTQDKASMTSRIIKAIEHPCSRILAHLTGRLLLKRDGYEIDLNKVVDAAIQNNVAIELNCNPQRMDMDWRYWHRAIDRGALCSLNPDAHHLSHFDFIDQGIKCCKKGWLTADHILNCWEPEKIDEFFGLL